MEWRADFERDERTHAGRLKVRLDSRDRILGTGNHGLIE